MKKPIIHYLSRQHSLIQVGSNATIFSLEGSSKPIISTSPVTRIHTDGKAFETNDALYMGV